MKDESYSKQCSFIIYPVTTQTTQFTYQQALSILQGYLLQKQQKVKISRRGHRCVRARAHTQNRVPQNLKKKKIKDTQEILQDRIRTFTINSYKNLLYQT